MYRRGAMHAISIIKPQTNTASLTYPPRRQDQGPHRAALDDELLDAVEQRERRLRGDRVALVRANGLLEAGLLVLLVGEGLCGWVCVCCRRVCLSSRDRVLYIASLHHADAQRPIHTAHPPHT